MVMVKEAGSKKHPMRRTAGIRWDRWHRMMVMRSLQMMVMSKVVRRAETDPPQHLDDSTDIEADPEASISMPPEFSDEEGWFTQFFRRRTASPIMHERRTT